MFDRIARDVTRETSRRGVLGGVLGGALALVSEGSAFAIKRRKRRGHTSPDGSETESALPPGTLAGGIWEETIDICHFDPESGKFKVIPVSTPTVPQYLNAGDTLFIDCCADADCVELPCLTPTGCIQGACAYDTTEGAPCALTDGTTGYCDHDATCVASYVAPSDTGSQPSEDTGSDTSGDTSGDTGGDTSLQS